MINKNNPKTLEKSIQITPWKQIQQEEYLSSLINKRRKKEEPVTKEKRKDQEYRRCKTIAMNNEKQPKVELFDVDSKTVKRKINKTLSYSRPQILKSGLSMMNLMLPQSNSQVLKKKAFKLKIRLGQTQSLRSCRVPDQKKRSNKKNIAQKFITQFEQPIHNEQFCSANQIQFGKSIMKNLKRKQLFKKSQRPYISVLNKLDKLNSAVWLIDKHDKSSDRKDIISSHSTLTKIKRKQPKNPEKLNQCTNNNFFCKTNRIYFDSTRLN